MHRLVNFLLEFGSKIQLIAFVFLFVLLWNIENIAGFIISYKKWSHAVVNFPFILADLPIQFLMGVLFVKAVGWTALHHFGLLSYLPIEHHPILYFIVSFMLLDLGEYVYHLIMHKVKRLWMFHLVHHSDQVLDVSTTLREHPGETLIRLVFTLLWVFFGGIHMWALIFRQLIQAIATPLVHMNYRLPEKFDKILSVVFITPNIHQVHHHYKQPYTDCNYGDVLSIWDRIFGTMKRMPVGELKFGVDTFMDNEQVGKFLPLLKIPFMKYRSTHDIVGDESNNRQ